MSTSLRERLNVGAGIVVGGALRDGRSRCGERRIKQEAGRKPWSERDRAPWGDGDPDGEDNGAFDVPPGEESGIRPNPDPDGDYDDTRNIVGRAAEHLTLSKPGVFNALLAIESRLAEISLYLPIALSGLPAGEAHSRLQHLQNIL